jgi:hypothetical protein
VYEYRSYGRDNLAAFLQSEQDTPVPHFVHAMRSDDPAYHDSHRQETLDYHGSKFNFRKWMSHRAGETVT